MSLLSELGSNIKTNLDTVDADLASAKSSLETAIGQKLDNVEFKTLDGTDLTGTGDIDLTNIGGGVVLAKHSGAFSSLKLDWQTQAKKYGIIKLFINQPQNSWVSCCGSYNRICLIDGCNEMCGCYSGTNRTQRCNSMGCYCHGCNCASFTPYGDMAGGQWCCGGVVSETTIFSNKCCYNAQIQSASSFIWGREGGAGGASVEEANDAYCIKNGVNGLCLVGAGPWGAGTVHIIVIGYDPH